MKPTINERLAEARRQLDFADRRRGTHMNDAAIGNVMLAISQIIDVLEEANTTDEPDGADELINDYRARKQAWAEYVDRNREAAQ